MSKFVQDFSHIQFTQEEKAALAQRLQQAAQQQAAVPDRSGKRTGKLRRGAVIGLAAAALLTAGALAAVLRPAWGGLFSFQSSQEQSLLEELTYEIGQTKTAGDWEITLSRCAGDDQMLYIWVEMKAPDDFVYEPPEDYLNLYADWDLMVDGAQQKSGSGTIRIDWSEETRTITYCSGWPTGDSVVGKTANIVLDPLRWDGWDRETEQWVTLPLWESEVVFEHVLLNYPNQTIRLTPNAEVPYLDGTTTLTQLEISPFRALARVEGGSCYQHHWVTDGDGLRPNYDGSLDCQGALKVELHMKDGTVITPRTAVLSNCQDGFQTEDYSYAGECYVERRMEYEPTPISGLPDRIIDPAQVDYVTVCGVDIPIN